jgi:hypothetical protein
VKYIALSSSAFLIFLTFEVFRFGTLESSGGEPMINDKLLHATVFGGLAGLALLTYRAVQLAWSERRGTQRGPRPGSMFALTGTPELSFGLGYAAVSGALLEVLQSFTLTREPDVLDWLADCSGAVVILGCAQLLLLMGNRLWKAG